MSASVQPETLRGALERMLVESDNTACDVLLRLAGGPAAVTARLRESVTPGSPESAAYNP
ncbi:MAG TPA: serine hydrolase [Vicinamibacteria bacterium]|nr:serine hydrolase [Vicinamibacteria bacterium]